MTITVYLATVAFQEGGPSCGEAFTEAEVFATETEAVAFVAETLRRELNNAGIEVAEGENITATYVEAIGDGAYDLPSATWEVAAKTLAVRETFACSTN